MRRRFFLIFNAGAGRSRSAAVDALVAALKRAGAEITHGRATTAAEARIEAGTAGRSGSFDAVLAAGGDGTIRQTAAALTGTDCPIGAVMLGTGNVLAHELALPRETEALADLLLNGPVVTVPIARANGEPFLLMAGAGFDGRIIAALDPKLKLRIAKAAFVPPVLKTLTAPLDQLHVTVDGHAHTASWAVITNARHYGGAFVLAPGTSIRTPGLQAVLFHSRSKPRLVAQLISLATGTLAGRAGGGRDVSMIPCSRATITASMPVPAQVDGDDFATTPLDVRISDGTVRIIAPNY